MKNQKPIYAVMIEKLGYHSVWAKKEAAERHAEYRNRVNKPLKYSVLEITHYEMGKNWFDRGMVRFPDSVGTMELLC